MTQLICRAPGDEPLHVALTTGHTLLIEPAGTEVPAHFVKEALARGAVPITPNGQPLVPLGGGLLAAAPPTDRKTLIERAVQSLLDSTDPAAFNKDGKPSLSYVQKAAGFTVTRTELDAVWERMQADLAADDEPSTVD